MKPQVKKVLTGLIEKGFRFKCGAVKADKKVWFLSLPTGETVCVWYESGHVQTQFIIQ